MRPSLKIGILTTISAVIAWFISTLIGYLLGMSLRPRFELVFFLMGVVGLIMAIISFVAGQLRKADKKYKLAIWVMVELILVIIIVFVSVGVFIAMPVEKVMEDGLVIDYLGEANDIVTDDYNFIFYR